MFQIITTEKHLPEAVERKNKVRRCKLRGQVVVLEGSIIVPLNMECPCYLITALGTHCLILRVIEGMHGELESLVIFFLVEEMIRQMTQNHWVGRIKTISL